LLIASAAPLAAQAPEPDAAPSEPAPPAVPRTMAGTWEFSNADREKTCTIMFRNENARVGRRIEFDPKCAALFPFVPEIVGWRLSDNDFLRLLDAQGNAVLEFSEVESGIFEAPKPGEGILFIQMLRAANGQTWRFEEAEDSKWQRIPQTANPILMGRK
jgi:hypothetical protein